MGCTCPSRARPTERRSAARRPPAMAIAMRAISVCKVDRLPDDFPVSRLFRFLVKRSHELAAFLVVDVLDPRGTCERGNRRRCCEPSGDSLSQGYGYDIQDGGICVMHEQDYKVVRLLDELLPDALKPTKSGARLDCRVYFREKPDGSRWGEVVLVNPATGEAVTTDPDKSLPLDSEDALAWFLGEITEKGFPLAVAMRTEPRS